MRMLLATGSLAFALFCATAAHSQNCPAGEKCAPTNGCLGGVRTGPRCGTGRCQQGYHCITERDGIERCARNR